MYTALITVREKGDHVLFDIALDGIPFTRWRGPAKEIYLDPKYWKLKNSRFGLSNGLACVIEFQSLQLRMLQGELRYLRDPE